MSTGKKGRSYLGDRPCVPVDALLAIAMRIWRKRLRG